MTTPRSQHKRGIVTDIVALSVATLALLSACFPQLSAAQDEPVFRAPFVLKLRVDNKRYYEESFERVPYVAENDVYLFVGDTFGINVTIAENQISRITYQGNPARADVEFKFTQEKSPNGLIMLLVIRNKLKHSLFLDARMTVPGKKEIYKTSVLPVKPNSSNVESWPHPIVQLVLRNFRVSDDGQKRGQTGGVHWSAPHGTLTISRKSM